MASRSVPVCLPVPPPRLIVRRDTGLSAYETALERAGFALVAGADEAGRGACAGPLVVAACILLRGRRGQIDGLADSKVLTPAVRE
jgi:ribonuclease HII